MRNGRDFGAVYLDGAVVIEPAAFDGKPEGALQRLHRGDAEFDRREAPELSGRASATALSVHPPVIGFAVFEAAQRVACGGGGPEEHWRLSVAEIDRVAPSASLPRKRYGQGLVGRARKRRGV